MELLLLHRYLCTQLFEAIANQLKAVFKQLKPCSNHGINVLFEHGFYLKILKKGRRTFTRRQPTMQVCVLSWFLLTSASFHSTRKGVKQNKNKMTSTDVHSASKRLLRDFFFRRLRQEYSWSYIQCKNITITHVCFIALTFAGSLGKGLNTRFCGLFVQNFLGARQMLMHEKYVWSLYY